MDKKLEEWEGSNFKAAHVGSFKELDKYSYTLPSLKITTSGKLFLNELLGITSSEISLNKLPPAKSIPFYHKHQKNEEVYIFLSGEGEFQIDDHIFPVGEGTVVCVHPEGERTWRNKSKSEDLIYIVVQAPEGQIEAIETNDGVTVRR